MYNVISHSISVTCWAESDRTCCPLIHFVSNIMVYFIIIPLISILVVMNICLRVRNELNSFLEVEYFVEYLYAENILHIFKMNVISYFRCLSSARPGLPSCLPRVLHCTRPHSLPLQVAGPQAGDSMLILWALPDRGLWVKARPPDTSRRAPPPS